MSDNDYSTEPPANIRQFVMVLYSRTPDGTGVGDEYEVFQGHMAYLNRHAALGSCPISGPFGDDLPLRGISIYDSTSVDEVQDWVRGDPAVVAGWLTTEVRLWWGVAGAALPS